MKLNRNNYEEYFLLYIDGELNAEDRREVENFLVAHPDLAEEMDMLKETVLRAEEEELVFADKELLLKPETETIHPGNYESFLLSYIDNELNHEDQKAVEAFTAQNPGAKAEMELLASAKLQPDLSIQHPDKESLYRKEEKRKIIYFRWQTWAVAAALTGLFLTIWMNQPEKSTGNEQPGFAQQNNGNDNGNLQPEASTPAEIIPDNNNRNTELASVETPGQQVEKAVTKEIPVIPVPERNDQQLAAVSSDDKIGNNKIQKLPVSIQPADINTSVAFQPNTPAMKVIAENEGDLEISKTGKASSLQALQSTLAANENATAKEEDVLLIGNARLNKDAFRGLFRKTGRFLERAANIGDQKTNELLNGKSNNSKQK